jgi:hypothetical protein
MSKRIKTIPKFASEAAEGAFWEKSAGEALGQLLDNP